MPSRINIGPENGPYVAINEENGNLQLEDNSGNVVAEWDETNAQWDFANNTLNNVDALNSNSVSVEEGNVQNVDDEDETAIPNTTFVEDKTGDETRHLVARDELTQTGDDISFHQDGLNAQSEHIIRYVALPRSPGSVRLRFNNDDGANYHYWNQSGTQISGVDKIPLADDDASAFAEHGARVHIYPGNQFIGVSNLIGDSRGRLNSFAQNGGYGSTTGLESVEITFPGWTTDDNAFVELWEVV